MMAVTCPDQLYALAGGFHTGSHPLIPSYSGFHRHFREPCLYGAPSPQQSHRLSGAESCISLRFQCWGVADLVGTSPNFTQTLWHLVSQRSSGVRVCLSSQWGRRQSASVPLSGSLPPCHIEHSCFPKLFFFHFQRFIEHQPQGHSSWMGSQKNFMLVLASPEA